MRTSGTVPRETEGQAMRLLLLEGESARVQCKCGHTFVSGGKACTMQGAVGAESRLAFCPECQEVADAVARSNDEE